MNEMEFFKGIADNLSKRECTAALSNYEVLCNNIKYVNDLLLWATSSLINIQKRLDTVYKKDDLVADTYKDNSSKYFYFRKIIPRVLLNDINIIKKFTEYTRPDDRNEITIETVGKLKKDFLDFNNLVTTARQFIDSLVADAYQFMELDPKEINFQVLRSLSYFNKYVTESIKQALFNPNIQNYLTEFEHLHGEKKCSTHKRQSKTKKTSVVIGQSRSFKEKVDLLFNRLNLKGDDLFKNEIKNLYDFSSEFIHIGYVSTFFTSSYDQEVIFGDDIGPYLPSTENFSELKYEILKTAINFFIKVYLPSVKNMLGQTLKQNSFEEFKELINHIISNLTTGLNT